MKRIKATIKALIKIPSIIFLMVFLLVGIVIMCVFGVIFAVINFLSLGILGEKLAPKLNELKGSCEEKLTESFNNKNKENE